MGINFVEKSENLSDNEIISKISNGKYEYLQVLTDRYMPLIIKKAKSFEGQGIETDDLIAEGFMGIFSAVKMFDERLSKFSTFVSVCIERAMISAVRTVGRKKRIPPDMLMPIEDVDLAGDENPEDIYINKESYNSLKENIFSELSEMEYNVLSLFLEGNTYADISEKLGISLKSVDNSLSRIRNKIKKQK
ncbi:MAG: sigma-70 family RNA polymerase sigma factor [Clostridia bacterium]|nr:sigma-70 family RNA polymerase sigma factor [Clostridia bacterium]